MTKEAIQRTQGLPELRQCESHQENWPVFHAAQHLHCEAAPHSPTAPSESKSMLAPGVERHEGTRTFMQPKEGTRTSTQAFLLIIYQIKKKK